MFAYHIEKKGIAIRLILTSPNPEHKSQPLHLAKQSCSGGPHAHFSPSSARRHVCSGRLLR